MSNDFVGDLISQPAQQMNEQREMGFKFIKHKMFEAYAPKLNHTNPMIRGSMLKAYKEALDDAFRVFSNILDNQAETTEIIG